MATTAPKSEMEQDAHEWMNRVNATAKDHSGITNPTGSVPWYTPFFGCFDPIDTCAITCCCPCITFGKTHHRLRKDANLVGYNVINASVCEFLHRPIPWELNNRSPASRRLCLVANIWGANLVSRMVGRILRGIALYPQSSATRRCP